MERIVTQNLRWIWREQQIADFGVDGQVEVVDHQGQPTGQLYAVQVKAGSSYFRGKGETIAFYIDEDHVKYWHRHALPVILVLHNPNDDTTIWQWASLETARATAKGWCIDVPRSKVFGADCKAELQDRDWGDDSIGLRRRFILDRGLMTEMKDRDAFVTIDKWVNKSLQYREIEIRFDDVYKDAPDITMPIMATWHYEVSDLMRHFFPWLDYEYFEDPDDSSGEIESHVMTVRLSKYAVAFLELESFFESPTRPSVPNDDEVATDEDWDDAHSLDEPPED